MNRRAFLGVALATTLVPTWLQKRKTPIDLQPFCAEDFPRWDISKPFVQYDGNQPYTFATNARIALRLPGVETPTGDPDRKIPPANRLPWQDREAPGWHPWPKQNLLLADETTCPDCKGAEKVCQICGEPYDPDRICACILSDYYTNRIACPTCKGMGRGVFPGVQRVGGLFVCQTFDKKVRLLPGLEFKTGQMTFTTMDDGRPKRLPAVALRFDGGDGILMPLDEEMTLKRLSPP